MAEPRPPLEQMTVYVVVFTGVTVAEPETAPPVPKFTPDELDDWAHDHVSVVAFPSLRIDGLGLKVGGVGGGGGGGGGLYPPLLLLLPLPPPHPPPDEPGLHDPRTSGGDGGPHTSVDDPPLARVLFETK
ncbi:hypothetical protein ACFL6I_18185 [candidate division KSB1 bacterium]